MAPKNWKIGLIILASILAFVLESVIKYSTVNKIPQEGFYLFKPILQIVYTPNYNIAFSVPLPIILIYFFIISALIFLSYLWWHNLKTCNMKLLLAISLVIVGAFSNLVDRFALGYVVDYINIFIWPIFNLADCLIVAGVLIYILSEIEFRKTT
jgi:signal peptidase II